MVFGVSAVEESPLFVGESAEDGVGLVHGFVACAFDGVGELLDRLLDRQVGFGDRFGAGVCGYLHAGGQALVQWDVPDDSADDAQRHRRAEGDAVDRAVDRAGDVPDDLAGRPLAVGLDGGVGKATRVGQGLVECVES